MRLRHLLAGAAIAVAAGLAALPARAAPPPAPGEDLILGSWALYSSRFVAPEGRVVDGANGGISHSEGQGYGMLIAVAADDRAGFERMLGWTRKELMVRDDGLAAWRWDPAADPHVSDRNNATDGDLLIAWALLRASKRWNEPKWRDEARAIADAVVETNVVASGGGKVLLPGSQGFQAGEQPDGPVVNLSYWIFPALEELGEISPKLRKADLAATGARLVTDARFGQAGLPADWTSLAGEHPAPAKGFPAEFGYNAVRVPLYLAWSRQPDSYLVGSFADALSPGAGGPRTVDLATGQTLERLSDPGYGAIVALLDCATGRSPRAEAATAFEPTQYYPSTLHILALMALAERYPQCLR
ncbi:endoglucanase [Aureimonas endophytica]|uniref:Glucanase n=1 Tax=Aureimonas endophytica TaxID=2027858 RepID=A0A917EE93_9HYPH|nr:glycosyl hydrolase family 8 [Aureimonas endophytica]GGE23337.1 endoglucanase [Aureimonas endophytica]